MTNDQQLKKIKELSVINKIECLREQTLSLLIDIINRNNICNILEIGTGVGYSSFAINKYANHFINITSIEKDQKRYILASENLKQFANIQVINSDCFNLENNQLNYYDLIIIDGPKRNQIKLIEHLKFFLKPNGMFFIDNLFLNKLRQKQNLNHSQQKVLNDIDMLNKYIKTQTNFKYEIFNIDDGVCLLTKISV